MASAPSIGEVTFEFGQLLRRVIWRPLQWMMGIFHLLPALAAVILFLLLFNIAQFREIYLSYLEDTRVVHIVWAVVGFALISAVLYQSHYLLSTMRIDVIYSNFSNPNTGINLRRLQEAAAFVWSFLPWVGLAVGFFFLQVHLEVMRKVLHSEVGNQNLGAYAGIDKLMAVPEVGHGVIVASVVLLGLVVAVLFDFHRKSHLVQGFIMLLTPSAAGAVFLLLTGSYPTDSTEWRAVASVHTAKLLAAMLLVTVLYYGIHYLLDTRRINFVYSGFWHRNTGINPRRRQRLATFFWALTPWGAIGLYFAKDLLDPGWLGREFPRIAVLLDGLPATGDWPIISVAIICILSVGLLVVLAMDASRQMLLTPWIVASAAAIAIFAAAVIPLPRLGFDVIGDFRWVGPLGSLALAYLFILSIFVLLALLSQRSGFPALMFASTAVALSVLFHISIETTAKWSFVACVVFVVLALVSRLWFVALVAGVLGALALVTTYREKQHNVDASALGDSSTAVMSLERRFDTWVAQRDRGADGRPPAPGATVKPYPAFIISAEGGGIYAAAAASLFLAKLQDDCPRFTQHVFAISAVSGGAIGATIFKALSQSLPASREACHVLESDGQLTKEVTDIMERDHFSPVVSSIVSDLLGEPMGRAEALEESFEDFKDPPRDIKDFQVVDRLKRPFLNSDSDDDAALGLVLNTTWAETGYRVAFAPFRLHSSAAQASAVQDGTLYSFADSGMPGEDKIPLMRAAVASARFPGILPPMSVKMPQTRMSAKEPQDRWWNFVDGGYADSSGAATALALFDALQPRSCDLKVDLKVILLTSADPRPDFQNLNGSDFHDTMAPIEAISSVRGLIGSQAVTRAYDHLKSPVPCPGQQVAPDWQILEVKLDDEKYSLPLGWKISKTTFNLISFLIGRPEPCAETVPLAPADQQNDGTGIEKKALETEIALQKNRCVMYQVEQTLSGGQ
jgi:hypothetical protein